MKLSERVAAIEAAIEQCNNTARAIITTSKVKFGEQLTGVNREAWDAQCKLLFKLRQTLTFAEGHILSAEHLIKELNK